MNTQISFIKYVAFLNHQQFDIGIFKMTYFLKKYIEMDAKKWNQHIDVSHSFPQSILQPEALLLTWIIFNPSMYK